MITEFLSYIPLLVKTLEKEKPKRIFEWSTGTSTAIISLMLPDSEIISVEHSLRWYWFWKFKFRNVENIKVVYVGDMIDYVTYPYSSRKYDFIFIDGRERMESLKVAKTILSKNGRVMLHDTFRKKYKEGTDLFKIEKEDRNTMLLSQSK